MDMSRTQELERNLAAVQERIRVAEKQAGRTPGQVRLLPVTKFHPVTDVEILHGLGVEAVGENREQEGRAKAESMPEMKFHMIGQVQTKKANSVARWASACHSVDSIKLADALNRGMALSIERGQRDAETNGILDCFIQVSADGDTARGGIVAEEVPALVEHMLNLEHLKINGLMVVPPLEADPAKVFAQTRQFADELGQQFSLDMELSAGMSADLEQAVAEGTNIVRVGTEILGKRPLA